MYKLIPKKEVVKEPFFRVTITADKNDGDYITSENELSKRDFNIIYPVLKFFVQYYGGHYQFKKWGFDDVPEEVIKHMSEHGIDYYKTLENLETEIELPYDYEWSQPCHTLEKIRVEYFAWNGKCYDVEL